jgi:MoxR-like ATPase
VFAQLVMADEVNRATPKAQSALLEAMESARSRRRRDASRCPEPFFIVRTQNPSFQSARSRCPNRRSTGS